MAERNQRLFICLSVFCLCRRILSSRRLLGHTLLVRSRVSSWLKQRRQQAKRPLFPNLNTRTKAPQPTYTPYTPARTPAQSSHQCNVSNQKSTTKAPAPLSCLETGHPWMMELKLTCQVILAILRKKMLMPIYIVFFMAQEQESDYQFLLNFLSSYCLQEIFLVALDMLSYV